MMLFCLQKLDSFRPKQTRACERMNKMTRDLAYTNVDQTEEVLAKKEKIKQVYAKMDDIAKTYNEFMAKIEAVSQEISEFVGSDVDETLSQSEFRGLVWLEREALVQQWLLSEK